MPSPGISFGDLMVFIAVLAIVAVFLAVLRSFLRRDETPNPPLESPRRRPEETPLPESRVPVNRDVPSSPTAAR